MLLTRERLTAVFTWVVVAYAAMVTLPSLPVAAGTGFDASWMIGLNRAHAQGLVAGRDLVFTYGPLGYLLTPVPGYASSPAALLYVLSFWLATVYALIRLAQMVESRVAGLSAILLLTLSVLADQGNSRITALIALTLVCLHHSRWRYLEAAALGVMAGVAFLTKFNEGVEGIALFAIAMWAIVARDWRSQRVGAGAILAAASLPASVAILFAMAGGPLSALPAFVSNSIQIAMGYTDAMSLDGPAWQPIAGIVGVALVLLAALWVTRQRDAAGLWPALAAALVAAFLAFKWSMVRQDAFHAARLEMRIALAALFLLLSAKTWREQRVILAVQIVLLVSNLALIGVGLSGTAATAESVRAWNLVDSPSGTAAAAAESARASNLAHSRVKRLIWPVGHVFEYLRWQSNWERVRSAQAAALETLRLNPEYGRIVGDGTVDAMGWEIDSVEANAGHWRPRPVIQSASAYTPELDELNARRLAAEGANYLLLGFTTVDDRHPLFEQPLSWRVALEHYRLAWEDNRFALLSRKQGTQEMALETIGRASARWGKKIPAPAFRGDLLLLHCHLKPSFWGLAAKTAFRVSPVYLALTFQSGRVVKRRVVPETAGAGIVVAPFPMNAAEASALFRGDFEVRDALRWVQLESAAPAEFQEPIEIEWSSLRLAD